MARNLSLVDVRRKMHVDCLYLGHQAVGLLPEWCRLVLLRAPEHSAAPLLAVTFALAVQNRPRAWAEIELWRWIERLYPDSRKEPEVVLEWVSAGRDDLIRLGFIEPEAADVALLTWPTSHALYALEPMGAA